MPLNIVPSVKKPNADAVELLESMIERVKSGEIAAVAISCVTSDGGITGEISSGDNDIMMWASIEHSARHFYENSVLGSQE